MLTCGFMRWVGPFFFLRAGSSPRFRRAGSKQHRLMQDFRHNLRLTSKAPLQGGEYFMKFLVILSLAILSVSGCAGSRVQDPPSTTLPDGTRHYFIKTNFKPCQSSREWATTTLTRRANEICKSGYVLVNEQTPVNLLPRGTGPLEQELQWEIKCKNPK
jgi:hypothetical protein